MTDRVADISIRQAAIIAGLVILLMAVPAVFAEFFVRASLIVSGDAAETANNISESEGLFRAGIFSYLIVVVLDVVAAWALYVFLRPVNKSLALLQAWFRLIYASIFGAALLNLVIGLYLLAGADYLTVFGTDQLNAQALFFLNAFDYGWDVGYVLFALHLGLLGYLAFKSGYVPRILGILVMISGLGYLVEVLAFFLFDFDAEAVALFTFIGEPLFAIWLVIKGLRGIDAPQALPE